MSINQVVQSYGTESLIGISPVIADIREFHMRPDGDGQSLFKLITQHPDTPDTEIGTGLLTPDQFEGFFGKNSQAVTKRLTDRGYCRSLGDNQYVLTWKFRNIAIEDFDIGLDTEQNASIHRRLESLLWSAMPESDGVDQFLDVVFRGSDREFSSAHRISETEFWFRQGNVIHSFRFSSLPSEELVQLIDLKLDRIQQEKMQNYFHIVSSFNADATMWMREQNRNRRFFEIIENLIHYTWRPFDMESCEVSINAAGDEGLIASGSLKVDFAENGEPTPIFDGIEKRFSPPEDGNRMFVVNDVTLRAAEATGNSSTLSMRMVSRTTGNVDPRRNMLTHRFVKLFVESVGKLIDVIMPVIRREEALQNLKWRSFLDTLRLQSIAYGEDLHRILTEALKVLSRFFGITEVRIWTEDPEIGNMLRLFSRKDTGERLYLFLDNALSPADILRRQLLVFPIRELQGGRILLYFEIPRTGNRPLNPEIPDHYLMGTELWQGVNEEALMTGLTDLKDYLFFMVTECLSTNPKKIIENLNRRLAVRGGEYDVEGLMRLSRRVLEHFARFFDLFGALSSNLESGLAYMRARRDGLSGLYNRQQFKLILNEYFVRPSYKFGLMFIDMDNFKIFNDSVSHDFGDKLLISLANRMIECADRPEGGTPGRFGGDEFCYAVGGIERQDFERQSVDIFKTITHRPLVVSFYFDDRREGEGMEINLISFLHRLMRPDVGSRQASMTEYVEKAHVSPRNHVIDIWKHYMKLNNKSFGDKVKPSRIIDDVVREIELKIVFNKIFPEIDPEFSDIIRQFVELQLRDFTTNRIRDYLITEHGTMTIEREITIKVSAGLAHSTEDRKRSVDSLFKAAESRAYLAKHNGRNCMFGIAGHKLA